MSVSLVSTPSALDLLLAPAEHALIFIFPTWCSVLAGGLVFPLASGARRRSCFDSQTAVQPTGLGSSTVFPRLISTPGPFSRSVPADFLSSFAVFGPCARICLPFDFLFRHQVNLGFGLRG
jgi:hypothetical protein